MTSKSPYFYPLPYQNLIDRFSAPFARLASGKSATIVGMHGNGRTSHLRFISSQKELQNDLNLPQGKHALIFFDIDRTDATFISFLSDLLLNIAKLNKSDSQKDLDQILISRDSYLITHHIFDQIQSITTYQQLTIIITLNERCLSFISDIDRVVVQIQKAASKHPVAILWSIDLTVLANYQPGHASSTFISGLTYHPTFTPEETIYCLERHAVNEDKQLSGMIRKSCMELTGGISALFHPLIYLISTHPDPKTLRNTLFNSNIVKNTLKKVTHEMIIIPDHAQKCVTKEALAFIAQYNTEISHHSVENVILRKNPTAQDIQLIQLFQSNPKQQIHREKIAEILWGSAWVDHYSDWAITKAVSRLRSKLSPNFKIVTIKNFGYQLYTL